MSVSANEMEERYSAENQGQPQDSRHAVIQGTQDQQRWTESHQQEEEVADMIERHEDHHHPAQRVDMSGGASRSTAHSAGAIPWWRS
jgi:hypothetical protein